MTGVSSNVVDAEVVTARGIARDLAAAVSRFFWRRPARDEAGNWNPTGGHNECGYWLPSGWQQTVADPAVVYGWQPEMALAAVMGHGLDLIDVDPRNGGRLDPAR
ncbi:MAG TPA: hypothetical protein VGM75_36665 [Pseudonocardiaceae bacterium]